MKKTCRSFATSLLVAVASLSLLTVCPGCATTGQTQAGMVVKARNENEFLVDDQVVDLEQLPRALTRAGAGSETEIIVEMPAGASPNSMRQIYPALQSAGFKKIILSHPREATATVKPLTPATSPPVRTLSPTRPRRRK